MKKNLVKLMAFALATVSLASCGGQPTAEPTHARIKPSLVVNESRFFIKLSPLKIKIL